MSALPRRHSELLYMAALEFNSTLDFEALLPRVFDRVVEILEAEAGSIWLVRGDEIVCSLARGPASEGLEGLELPIGAGIVGHVAQSGAGELVADAREDSRFVHQVDEATGFVTRSMVAAPLKAQSRVLGVFQLLNKRSDHGGFDAEDLGLLESLGVTAGLALRNAELHTAEKQARDLKSLLEISNEITSTLDLDRLVLSVVNLGSRAIDYDRAAISLVDAGHLAIRAVSGRDEVGRRIEDEELERLIAWLAEGERVVYVPDLESKDEETVGRLNGSFGELLRRDGVRSLCLVPLEDDEGRLGALYMDAGEPDFLGDGELEAVELLGNQVSVALRNAQLYEQVPFRGILEPVAALRRRVADTPGHRWRTELRKVAIPAAVALALLLVPWGERVKPRESILVPGERMPVRATVSGLVVESRVDEGQRVEPGEVLAVLRNDDVRVEIEEASAALAVAERAAADARAGGRSTDARVADLQAEELRQRLSILDERLGRARLRATVAGVVLTPRPGDRVGEWLEAGETFVVVGRTDRLEVESRVSQGDIGRVEPGQRIRFKVPARPEYTFVGTVTRVAAHGDSVPGDAGPTFIVRSELVNDREILRPGMDASAKIVGPLRPLGYHLFRPFAHWVRMRFWR